MRGAAWAVMSGAASVVLAIAPQAEEDWRIERRFSGFIGVFLPFSTIGRVAARLV